MYCIYCIYIPTLYTYNNIVDLKASIEISINKLVNQSNIFHALVVEFGSNNYIIISVITNQKQNETQKMYNNKIYYIFIEYTFTALNLYIFKILCLIKIIICVENNKTKVQYCSCQELG